MLTSNLSKNTWQVLRKGAMLKGSSVTVTEDLSRWAWHLLFSVQLGISHVDEISCAAVEVSKSKLNMLRKWKYWYQAYSTMSSRAPKVHARCQKGKPCCHGATSSYNSHFVKVLPALYYNLYYNPPKWNDSCRYTCSMTSSTLMASALCGMITEERWPILKALYDILLENIHILRWSRQLW